MADNDEQQPLSRVGHFVAGAAGNPEHIATVIPVRQATAAFQPSSVQMAQNAFSGVGLGSSDSTVRVTEAYQASMRDQLKAGEGAMP